MIPERAFIHNSRIGGKKPIFVIAGPCLIETEDLANQVCDTLQRLCDQLNILYIFKASFDKANRSDVHSKRGLGIQKGLEILQKIKSRFQVPITTDVHECSQIPMVAPIVDVIQIPAFLSRQTDLLIESAKTGLWVNVKKGQFMAPIDTERIKSKITTNRCLITERGSSFGYHNLIFDPRSVPIIHKYQLPFIIDATHSIQLPGQGKESGGEIQFMETVARAAIVQGIEGLFFETHPDPKNAWSDSATQIPLEQVALFLQKMVKLDAMVKNQLYS